MIAVPGTLPNPLWGAIARELGRQLESAVDLTVFGAGPGTVAPLPDALGGDPLELPRLTGGASTAKGFLALLRAKAHFLLLPERVVDDVSAAGLRFDFSGWFLTEEAETRYVGNTVVAVRLASGTPAYLAGLGASIGRGSSVSSTSALDTIYHELCHAWMVEIVAAFDAWQRRARDGEAHYASARVRGGGAISARAAYLEAAGSYVGQRVAAWYQALELLSGLLTVGGTAPADRRTTVARQLREEYDRSWGRQVYGTVNSAPLLAPSLPPELRAALDAQVLDGLPLTRSFDETPLRALYDAVLAP